MPDLTGVIADAIRRHAGTHPTDVLSAYIADEILTSQWLRDRDGAQRLVGALAVTDDVCDRYLGDLLCTVSGPHQTHVYVSTSGVPDAHAKSSGE